MITKYDITDYLKDDKELQKAVIEELLNENAKLNAIIDGYQPRLQALKDENERLKEEIKEVKKYQYEQEYLDKEIEEMQKALKTLAEGLNKRQILLQEIKEMAKRGFAICDDDCGNAIRYTQILDIINKAEEE